MPYNDVYCMLSGIAAGGPPSIIPDDEDGIIEAIVNGLVERLINTGRTDIPPAAELTEILTDTMTNHGRSLNGERWGDTGAVFGPTLTDEENPAYLRFCKDKAYMAWFDKMLTPNGEWIDHTVWIWESDPGDHHCAFMFRKCWDYFQSWLDVLPPGVREGTPFAKALWDVVEPSMGKGWPSDSILPELEYGNMLFTWGQDEQDFWDPLDGDDGKEIEEKVAEALNRHCSKNVPNLALHGDLGTWMFEDPDSDSPSFRVFQLSTLPLDILLEILPNLNLFNVLNTSSVCKSMRNLVLREDVFPTLLRKMIQHGSLR
ncbi:hypothetical protein DL96DRAFT_1589191 [Flagelloscypha sp. PMI_526]|nr:hypothetical protein DL96DRAFT_1589191 [Flagelloscypha sp. PMI_526]